MTLYDQRSEDQRERDNYREMLRIAVEKIRQSRQREARKVNKSARIQYKTIYKEILKEYLGE